MAVACANNGFDQGEGFGVYIKYNKKELPRFVQWKMMGEQDYVCGLEPCNCGVEGRDVDEAHGLLPHLRSGERREFHMEFGKISTKKELREIQRASKGVRPKLAESYLDFVKKPSTLKVVGTLGASCLAYRKLGLLGVVAVPAAGCAAKKFKLNKWF